MYDLWILLLLGLLCTAVLLSFVWFYRNNTEIGMHLEAKINTITFNTITNMNLEAKLHGVITQTLDELGMIPKDEEIDETEKEEGVSLEEYLATLPELISSKTQTVITEMITDEDNLKEIKTFFQSIVSEIVQAPIPGMEKITDEEKEKGKAFAGGVMINSILEEHDLLGTVLNTQLGENWQDQVLDNPKVFVTAMQLLENWGVAKLFKSNNLLKKISSPGQSKRGQSSNRW